MIIFGTRGVTRTAASGEFNCPQCGVSRPYRTRRVRRFFTLYFLPVIPLDVLGEYVECESCKVTFRPAVIGLPAVDVAAFESELHRAIRRTMVLMMLADGVIEQAEITTIREVYRKVANAEMTDDEVRRDAELAAAERRTVHDYLASLVGTLNDNGKELVLKAAYFVAVADAEYAASERSLVEEIGAALDMTREHIDGVFGSLDG